MFASKDVFLKSSGGGYTIARSVRFRSSATASLSRTFSTTGTSRQIFTLSVWVKRGTLGAIQQIMGCYDGSVGAATGLYFTASDTLNFDYGGTVQYQILTTQVFRDPSSWYHIVVACDSTQATAANRVKIYVNGSQVTAFSTANYPAQNANGQWMINTANNKIGTQWNSASNWLDGYLAEMNFVDGQQLAPTAFGAFNIYGVWQPARYTGTYGTNGFYLKFNSYATAAALGTDSSGNGNTWTVNNLSVTAGVTYDSMTDVPTLTSATAANYPTWNPLWQGRTNAPTNGNLDYPASSVGIGTMALSGSSYWEITSTGGTSTVALYSTAVSTSQTVTTGLTYGFRFNATTGAFDYTTNGSSFTSIATGLTSGPYFFYVSTAAATTASLNAGQRPFSYTAPTGFVALNTYNLATPTIANGAAYMAATTYTGTGAVRSIDNSVNGTSMQPDLIWVKNRNSTQSHIWTDVLRGVTKQLYSNTTSAEGSDSNAVTAFNANGFSLGTDAGGIGVNTNTNTYVAWQWKANGTGVSNTSGSITSTVSAGATQGVAVVTYTGTGAAATVGHGLSATPSMIIVKKRSGAGTTWAVYNVNIGAANSVSLNSTAASSAQNYWNSTTPTSSVWSMTGNAEVNGSGETYVAYCFAPVAGYSAFGTYTGNGSADGPFVYLGFRPRFLLIKRTDAVANWRIHDSSRDTYDVTSKSLYPNLSNAETSAASEYWDFLSNGFKLRTSDAESNASSGTYIYMAFAENPFRYALAY